MSTCIFRTAVDEKLGFTLSHIKTEKGTLQNSDGSFAEAFPLGNAITGVKILILVTSHRIRTHGHKKEREKEKKMIKSYSFSINDKILFFVSRRKYKTRQLVTPFALFFFFFFPWHLLYWAFFLSRSLTTKNTVSTKRVHIYEMTNYT